MQEENYDVVSDGVLAKVRISKPAGEYVPTYSLKFPSVEPGTEAFMDGVKAELLKKLPISYRDATEDHHVQELKDEIHKRACTLLHNEIPSLPESKCQILRGRLIHEMLGLGEMEFFLNDDNLEEICVNSAKSPIWVYHRKHGWLKTSLQLQSESQILNYSSLIGRRIGRQITIQEPLLDAYLPTGDRANATLCPISAFGNTITIRKFARKPWTITDFITANTINSDAAAFLWLSVQYELSVIVSGGTGAGKTSLLNVLSAFIPPNQRTVSIEQTREITIPTHLQWVPLVVRQPTSEGSGGVQMLDLMVNSLRMRPDRIIVGEIRRAEEAQVLFEAIHTGHSVYATLHAETVDETFKRLANPPIGLPAVVLGSLHLIVAMFRDRRSGIRRVFEIGEVLPTMREEDNSIRMLYRWRSNRDTFEQDNPSVRVVDTIKRFTRMGDDEIAGTLAERKKILNYMVEKGINSVDSVGKLIAQYYSDPKELMDKIKQNEKKK